MPFVRHEDYSLKWIAAGLDLDWIGRRRSTKSAVEFRVMRRLSAVAGSAVFLVIAPGTVAGYIPWRICRWHVEAPLAGIYLLRILGVLLIAAGLPILMDSFARFAFQGLGTPAPVFPTRHLVVSGLYRYVRNPMYVAVVWLILGQGLFFGNVGVLEYGIAIWAAFHLFVLIYEEPTLRRAYGSEYKDFSKNVHRWVPRLRPWRQTPGSRGSNNRAANGSAARSASNSKAN